MGLLKRKFRQYKSNASYNITSSSAALAVGRMEKKRVYREAYRKEKAKQIRSQANQAARKKYAPRNVQQPSQAFGLFGPSSKINTSDFLDVPFKKKKGDNNFY